MINDDLAAEFGGHSADTSFAGWHIQYFPCLGSTMDTAREAALAGAADKTVVLAGEQTSGRGRLKREWLSPRGCLTFSLILYPETRHLPGLVMVAALAAADTVTALAPVKAGLKWPNDVLVGGKKISGILAETGMTPETQNYAVVGIGLNVNMDPAVYLEISATATSLSVEAGRDLPRAAVLRTLLTRFERWYGALLDGAPVFESWRTRLTTLGKAVRVLVGDEFYEGVAEDVAPDGALLLRLEGGRLMKMPAGDVTLKTE